MIGMKNFFAEVTSRTHSWPEGRRDLHWHVLPDRRAVREQLVEPYAELTHMPGLEPVAPEWLHTTILHSGPEDSATDTEIARIVTLVRERVAEVAPFELTFNPPAVGRVGLECTARPGAPARRLWEIAWQATTEVAGSRWPLIPDRHYAHASLAYAGPDAARADRKAMKIWLSDHGPGLVTLPVTALSLVSQWHDGRRIMWDHITDVPLGVSS
ncbi:2'-5' RNA ligase family protein [Streptomyces sp. NPDC088116]|uniref:2'-5' RNA ligase family protein n=1 Tax=Streptomyces sp. NPDC088116 TaxID=3365825 RepID=UPI003823E916